MAHGAGVSQGPRSRAAAPRDGAAPERAVAAGPSRGKLALKVLEQLSGVDLLFTDVGLPDGMNGRELAHEAQRRWPRLKVLYTTGYARNSIIHHGRLDPGMELITKPFTQSSLAAKVRRMLGTGANITA
ncbi:MAG: response regulator [Steroidobacteraceae bacterium]